MNKTLLFLVTLISISLYSCAHKKSKTTVVINALEVLKCIDKEYPMFKDSIDKYIYLSNTVPIRDGDFGGKFYMFDDSTVINGKHIKIVDPKSAKDSIMNQLYDLSIYYEHDKDFFLLRRGARSDMLGKFYVNKDETSYGFSEFRIQEDKGGFKVVGYNIGLEIVSIN